MAQGKRDTRRAVLQMAASTVLLMVVYVTAPSVFPTRPTRTLLMSYPESPPRGARIIRHNEFSEDDMEMRDAARQDNGEVDFAVKQSRARAPELRFNAYSGGFQSLSNRPCTSQCDKNMGVCTHAPTALPGTSVCVKEQSACYWTACQQPDWERHAVCWAGSFSP